MCPRLNQGALLGFHAFEVLQWRVTTKSHQISIRRRPDEVGLGEVIGRRTGGAVERRSWRDFGPAIGWKNIIGFKQAPVKVGELGCLSTIVLGKDTTWCASSSWDLI